jgi:putative transposase
VHPEKPKLGLRTTRPNEAWHIDTTVVRLLNGSKAYVHAIIDNFSRRILAYRVADCFDVANSIAVLVAAAKGVVGVSEAGRSPMLVVDGGVENFNGDVDKLIKSGVLRRVLAMTEIEFSNSLIEAFWRTMKHQWLFLNTLDSVAALRRHVSFYVVAHNTQVPHSAFRGQTPDETYFSTGEHVPAELASAKSAALEARLHANRSLLCENCGRLSAAAHGDLSVAA